MRAYPRKAVVKRSKAAGCRVAVELVRRGRCRMVAALNPAVADNKHSENVSGSSS